MRILLISLLLLAANMYYWTSVETLEALRLGAGLGQPLAVKDALLSLIALLLLIEAVFVLFKDPGKSEDLWAQELDETRTQAAALEAENTRLSAAVEQSASRLAESQKDAALKKEENSRLTTALEELKTRLSEFEKQSSAASRPEEVDAELLNLLAVLQEKGRLVDFLMDDIAPYADEQVGAAARVVHQGCAPALREYFTIEPVHQGTEGESLTIEKSFSPKRYRLIGSVSGEPPFTGTVLHRGWRAAKVMLPRLSEHAQAGDEQGIIAPTEVQV